MISAILNQLMAHTGTKPLAWHRDEWLMDCMVAWASGSPRPVRGGQLLQTGFLMDSRCLCVFAYVCVCMPVSTCKHHVSCIIYRPCTQGHDNVHAGAFPRPQKTPLEGNPASVEVKKVHVEVEKKKIGWRADQTDGVLVPIDFLVLSVFIIFFHSRFSFFLVSFQSLFCHCASSVVIKPVILHQHSIIIISLTPTCLHTLQTRPRRCFNAMHANVTWLPLVSASASVSVQPSVIMLLMKQPANGRAEHLQSSPGTALDQITATPTTLPSNANERL
ncbi:hypothetical protein J3E69DRAFT_313201 [Trichoderma sp. SZMC 28015]